MPKIIDAICEHCGDTFQRMVYPSRNPPTFCSPACRNKARALPPNPPETCSQCGNLFRQRIRTQPSKYCSAGCGHKARTGKRLREHTYIHQEIIKNYASEGAVSLSIRLAIPVFSVCNIAYSYNLTLDRDKYRDVVHGAASKYMATNNPMHNSESKAKGMRTARKSPKRAEHMRKFQEGHRRLEKTKPSKPELRVCKILGKLGISYEHQAKIGNKFFVDFKIGPLIIQVDGEYWHGHPSLSPLTKRQVSQQKRDRSHDAYCRACGYQVVRIWAKEITETAILDIVDHITPADGPST